MQTIIHLQVKLQQQVKMQTISAIAINCGTFIQMLAIVFNLEH